jgi:hypothetical protein
MIAVALSSIGFLTFFLIELSIKLQRGLDEFLRVVLYHLMAYGVISILVALLCVTKILKGISQRDQQIQLRKERERRREARQ